MEGVQPKYFDTKLRAGGGGRGAYNWYFTGFNGILRDFTGFYW